jgi:acyl carrier protein
MTTEPEVLREELLDIISKEGLIERAKLTPDATLETLNFASYDMVMILMAIEEKYSVYLPVDESLTNVKTLEELLNVLTAKIIDQQLNPIQRPADADVVKPVANAADAFKPDPAPAAKPAADAPASEKSGAENP